MAGCEPTVNNLYPPIEYPVSKGTPSISPYCTWFHGDCDVVTPPYKPPQVFTFSLNVMKYDLTRSKEKGLSSYR